MKRKQTLASLKKKAWDLLSLIVRQSFADEFGYLNCYTCSKRMHWKASQSGHAIPGRAGAVLLDESIIRPQCYRCNVPMRGMHHIFAARLIGENGEKWYAKKLFDSRKIVKYSRVDLLSLIEEYKARLSRIQ